MQAWAQIASIIGTILVAGGVWAYLRKLIRENRDKLDELKEEVIKMAGGVQEAIATKADLERKIEKARDQNQALSKEIHALLTELASDIAYIRGRLSTTKTRGEESPS